jgi:hypothetical protein
MITGPYDEVFSEPREPRLNLLLDQVMRLWPESR